MYSHNHNRTKKFRCVFFLHFVQKSPVRGKCSVSRYTISIMYVLWLYVRSVREKVYLTLKMRIRNKTSHLFVVKIPKLVISIKDNEEKQNCSKQQYCDK